MQLRVHAFYTNRREVHHTVPRTTTSKTALANPNSRICSYEDKQPAAHVGAQGLCVYQYWVDTRLQLIWVHKVCVCISTRWIRDCSSYGCTRFVCVSVLGGYKIAGGKGLTFILSMHHPRSAMPLSQVTFCHCHFFSRTPACLPSCHLGIHHAPLSGAESDP